MDYKIKSISDEISDVNEEIDRIKDNIQNKLDLVKK